MLFVPCNELWSIYLKIELEIVDAITKKTLATLANVSFTLFQCLCGIKIKNKSTSKLTL